MLIKWIAIIIIGLLAVQVIANIFMLKRNPTPMRKTHLNDLKEIAKSSKTKKEFINKMNEAYPNFGWPFYLEGNANFLFEK